MVFPSLLFIVYSEKISLCPFLDLYVKTPIRESGELLETSLQQIGRVLKRESEAKKIINKNFRAMEEHLNKISKTTLEEVSKRLQEAFEQFSSDQEEQDNIINGHSDDLNMLKDKLKLASDMSDATTPEWVNAIDELTSQFSSALTDLEKRFNEDSNELNMKLDSLQTLLKGELPLQPRV